MPTSLFRLFAAAVRDLPRRICLPFQFDKESPVSVSFMNPDLAYIVWVFYLSKVCDCDM